MDSSTSPNDAHAVGNLKVREKPLAENVPAIDSLMRLHEFTQDARYRRAAETALRTLVPIYEGHGEYALSVSRFLHPPVEVNVVGKPGSADTRGLLTAGANIPYAHVVIRLIDSNDTERVEETGYWAGDSAPRPTCA